MGKLLIATTNPAKLREFTALLASKVEIVTPAGLGLTDVPEEDGESFAENSLLKSNFYWQRTDLPTLADDGGLEIDALGGQPGVHSRRIDGQERSDQELIKIILERIRQVPAARRTARMKTVVTLRVARDRNFQAEASIEGLIRPSRLTPERGYPYRAILWIPKYKKFMQELAPAEMETLNHRRKAINDLLPYIEQYV